jgi:hypothetical protein
MNKNLVWEISSFKNQKRHKPRIKVEIEGKLKIKDKKLNILILNIGVGGCYFQSFSTFNLGEKVEISFVLQKKVLTVEGTIFRINNKNYTIRYENPSEEFIAMIEKYILNFYGVIK